MWCKLNTGTSKVIRDLLVRPKEIKQWVVKMDELEGYCIDYKF